MDLSVFQPRGKRKCVIRNESRNKHRSEWWDLGVDGEHEKRDDDEEGEDDEQDGEDDDPKEDDEDYQHGMWVIHKHFLEFFSELSANCLHLLQYMFWSEIFFSIDHITAKAVSTKSLGIIFPAIWRTFEILKNFPWIS